MSTQSTREFQVALAQEVFRAGTRAALSAFQEGVFRDFDDARAIWAEKARGKELEAMIFDEIQQRIVLPILMADSEGLTSGRSIMEGMRDSAEDAVGRNPLEGGHVAGSSVGKESHEPAVLEQGGSGEARKPHAPKKAKKIKNVKLLKARARMGQ